MIDIEDIANDSKELLKPQSKSQQGIVTKKRKCAGKQENADPNTHFRRRNDSSNKTHSKVPGTQSVHVKTYGCSHNTSDSEYMMGLLYSYGYDIVDAVEQSDICVINSCTVKNPSQEAFINYVTKSKEYGKPVIVAGCVPQGDRNLKGLENCSIVGVTQIDRIVEVVEETLKGNIVRLLAKKELPSLDLPKIRRNQLIEIVPINLGCLGSCTYCKTKHARGKLTSYQPQAIINACVKACNSGAKEVWLTSEDTGVYGRDINTDLPSLMIKILKEMPPDVMIRLGMANPPYIMEHVEKMVKILNHPNVYSFIHIPVQSGSNGVLDRMIREYKIEEFNYVCDYLLKHVPNITIATDIICGFPTESQEDFDETLSLVSKYKFPVINISQFYSRPGTVAAKWKKVDSKEVKRRSTELAKLFGSYPNYAHLKNTVQRIWLHDTNEEEKNIGENYMVGHTKAYAKVLIKKDELLLGKQIIVKVTDTHKWHVYGEVIDSDPQPVAVNYNDYFKGMLEAKHSNVPRKEEAAAEKIDIHSLFDTKIQSQQHWKDQTTQKTVLIAICYALGIIFLLMGVTSSRAPYSHHHHQSVNQ